MANERTVNAQEFIDEKYPKKEDRSKVIELKISKREKGMNRFFDIIFSFFSKFSKKDEKKVILKETLEGELDLTDFMNLEILKIGDSGGLITSLNIKGLTKLEELNCSNNQIKEINVSSNIELRKFYCHENKNLEKITGLEKLKKLTFINSSPFCFLTNELGNNISSAKEFLGEYNDLMKKESDAYQRVVDSKDVFVQEEERNEAKEVKDDYEAKIEQVNTLIKKLN